MKEKFDILSGLDGCYVAGGAITSVYTNMPINDYDIYPKSEAARNGAIIWAFENNFINIHSSSRALTFIDSDENRVQIAIFDEFESHQKIFDFFDFTVCMGAYDLDTKKFHLHEKFLIHCSQRYLSFNPNTKYPYASAWRVQKYKERGFTIGKIEFMKILIACANLPICSWEDLKEQIGGVYGESIEIPDTSVEFNIENMFNCLSTIKPALNKTETKFSSSDEAISQMKTKEPVPYIVIPGVGSHRSDVYYAKFPGNDEYNLCNTRPLYGVQKAYTEMNPDLIFYKKVNPSDNQNEFNSIYDSQFKYRVGEEVSSKDPYIFCYSSLKDAKKYGYGKTGKVIKLKANSVDDIMIGNTYNMQFQLKKCLVIGEADE